MRTLGHDCLRNEGGEAAFIDIPSDHFVRLQIAGTNCIALLVEAADVRTLCGQTALFAITDPDQPLTTARIVRHFHQPEDLGSFEGYLAESNHREIYAKVIDNVKEIPHSLLIVRAIEWVKSRGGLQAYDSSLICRQALATARRDLDHEREMVRTLGELLAGAPRNKKTEPIV